MGLVFVLSVAGVGHKLATRREGRCWLKTRKETLAEKIMFQELRKFCPVRVYVYGVLAMIPVH